MKNFGSSLFFLAPVVFLSIPASAQDAGLYGKVVDPDLSFVRVLVSGDDQAMIAGKQVSTADHGVSPYINVEPGTIEVSAGAASAKIKTAPGRFYTLALQPDGASKVFTDAVSADVAKAELYFYNLSDLDSVDLFVPAAKVVAIAGVTKGGGKNVALRAPLTLKLELRHGDRLLAALDAVQLNRRAGVTIVLTGKADAYRAAVLENVIQ